MVVVGDVPSLWSEAAKGILHIKGIEGVAVRLVYGSVALKEWGRQRNGPVAINENERPRPGWAEILLLADAWHAIDRYCQRIALSALCSLASPTNLRGSGPGLVVPPAIDARGPS